MGSSKASIVDNILALMLGMDFSHCSSQKCTALQLDLENACLVLLFTLLLPFGPFVICCATHPLMVAFEKLSSSGDIQGALIPGFPPLLI